jgi:hypothetical protein
MMESGKRRLIWLSVGGTLVLAMALLWPGSAGAEDVSYTTNTQTGQAIFPGTQDIGNHCDDCTTSIALPFPVSIYGSQYTSVSVSSNGNLQFSTDNSGWSTGCVSMPINGVDRSFVLYQGDLHTDGVNGGVFTATIGSPPNRQFVIEWRTTYDNRTGTANFESVFVEGSDTLAVIYGLTADAGLEETSGIQASDLGPFTQFSCGDPTLVSGLRVNYLPVAGPPPPPPPSPVRCRVPRVIGLRLARAKRTIRARHCSVGRIRRARSRRLGRVIAQNPRAGAVRRRGYPVRLVVGRR